MLAKLHVVGVGVVSLNLENAGLDEVNEAIGKSAGFVIGSPTLGGHMPTQVVHGEPKIHYTDKVRVVIDTSGLLNRIKIEASF